MGLTKYKYYFRKPKSEIVKDIFRLLLVSGAIAIAATSPHFLSNLLKARQKFKKYSKKKISDTFYQLKKQGLIEVNRDNHQLYISLTPQGKRKAGWLQIDDLRIDRPQRWDKKWWLILFDISELKKMHREAFRGKIKELGFLQLQKSVWLYPFDCRAEIELLRDFFGLKEQELRLVVADDIGGTKELKEFFKIS